MPNPSGFVRHARFGAFEVDFRAGELLKNGRRIRLQDQPLQVLAMFLEQPGEVVTREALRLKLWPTDTFVDFDHGLNNAINRLRDALNDSVEAPRFIETLPRRGYRFIFPVERGAIPSLGTARENSLVQLTPEQAGAVTALRGSRPFRRTRWIVLGTAAVVLTSLLGLAVSAWRGKLSSSAHPMRIEAIAVLPLENMTGDPAQQYLVDGMTDALTTDLAQMRGIRVISRTSAMHFKGAKKTLPEIAGELHVDALLEGSVSRSNDVLRINAQLIYAPGDRHIWARSYEGTTGSFHKIENEVASDVARAIGAAMPLDAASKTSVAFSVNPEAYDLYLRAEQFYGLETREANDEAIRLLEKAVEMDPKFAAAYAAMATAHRVRAFSLEPDQPAWIEKATVEVERALALDSNLAEGYVSRGFLLWSRANGWSYERAVADYRHALELNPNLAEAHHQLANVYNHVGLLDKADDEIKKAVTVDPLNAGIRYRVGINLLYKGKYQESLQMMHDSQKFMPSLWVFQTLFALQHMGRRQEAQERIEQFLKTGPPDRSGSLTAMQALLAADAGNAPLAERKIQEAITKGRGYQHFHHVAYAVASAYALLKKPEPALRYLRVATDDGFPCYPLLEHDSNLDHLRNDPRFLSFMTEQKRQWEYFRAHL